MLPSDALAMHGIRRNARTERENLLANINPP
jgi:hypothetical protein